MKNRNLLLIHVLLGFAGFMAPIISTFWGAGFFLFAAYKTISTRNRTGWAHLGAAYLVGIEVWLRMTGASLFWEFGKLGGMALLVLGILVGSRKQMKFHYLLIILLLLPAFFLAQNLNFGEWREAITFQTGGMILLSLSLVYFSRRVLTISELNRLFAFIVAPVLTLTIQVILKSPSVVQLTYGLAADFRTSGGYGPNQVSTLMGLGIAVLGFNLLAGMPPVFHKWVDRFLLVLFFARTALTFSRGGLVGAIVVLALGYVFFLGIRNINWQRVAVLIVSPLLLYFLFMGLNNLTGGVLLDRYSGETYETKLGRKEKNLSSSTSGRSEIVRTDLEMWSDHPMFGVGIGVSSQLRPQYGYTNNSHIEQTRLLSEHGLFGLGILLLLILYGLKRFFIANNLHRFILIVFSGLAFLTMFHSATRLAMVGFCFGLGFIYLIPDKYPVHRKQAQRPRVLEYNH